MCFLDDFFLGCFLGGAVGNSTPFNSSGMAAGGGTAVCMCLLMRFFLRACFCLVETAMMRYQDKGLQGDS